MTSLNCWTCGDGADSFAACDAKRTQVNCTERSKDACAVLTYDNSRNETIYIKSCMKRACDFCQKLGSSRPCRGQCCAEELYNSGLGFWSTASPTQSKTNAGTFPVSINLTHQPTATGKVKSEQTTHASTAPSASDRTSFYSMLLFIVSFTFYLLNMSQ